MIIKSKGQTKPWRKDVTLAVIKEICHLTADILAENMELFSKDQLSVDAQGNSVSVFCNQGQKRDLLGWLMFAAGCCAVQKKHRNSFTDEVTQAVDTCCRVYLGKRLLALSDEGVDEAVTGLRQVLCELEVQKELPPRWTYLT